MDQVSYKYNTGFLTKDTTLETTVRNLYCLCSQFYATFNLFLSLLDHYLTNDKLKSIFKTENMVVILQYVFPIFLVNYESYFSNLKFCDSLDFKALQWLGLWFYLNKSLILCVDLSILILKLLVSLK